MAACAAGRRSPYGDFSYSMASATPTVLIVEDDPDHLNLLQRLFSSNGFPCRCAANGREALVLLRDIVPPCVIVSDQNMPQMTGLELLEKATRIGAHPFGFILITGDADPAIRRAAAALGVHAVLEKPLNLKVLVERVRTAPPI